MLTIKFPFTNKINSRYLPLHARSDALVEQADHHNRRGALRHRVREAPHVHAGAQEAVEENREVGQVRQRAGDHQGPREGVPLVSHPRGIGQRNRRFVRKQPFLQAASR